MRTTCRDGRADPPRKPDLVINVALPYQDLPIMDACLETGVDYLDTANYEPPDEAKFEYKWQWAYQERFERAASWACSAAASIRA
jgi:saccharopine dehydrogenase (NAD+, L-lysine-forming)